MGNPIVATFVIFFDFPIFAALPTLVYPFVKFLANFTGSKGTSFLFCLTKDIANPTASAHSAFQFNNHNLLLYSDKIRVGYIFLFLYPKILKN